MSWRRFCVASFAVLFLGFPAAASPSFSGSLETTLAINPSALGVGDALLPDTLSTVTLQAGLDDLSVKSVATFDLDGLDYLALGAAGDFQNLSWDSTLTFSPLGDTRTKTKTVTEPVHWYDWGREYFVDQLVAADVDATSSWYIRVSADNSTWTTVTGTFDPTVHTSGPVSVNLLVRYVEVRATTGLLMASPSSPEKLTITYSNQLWKTNFTIPSGNLTLFGTVALPAAGSAYVFLAASYQEDSGLSLTASTKFGLQGPTRRLCFRQAVLEGDLSIGCVEGVTARIEIDDTGFDAFSLAADELPTGLSRLTLSGKLTFTVLSKALELEPELTLDGGPCFTLYGKVLTGTLSTEITGISLYGIGISHASNGVEVSSLSYLDDAHYVVVLGSQSCWEALALSVSTDSCCGGITDFKITTCFSKSSGSLFDWAETDVVLGVGLSATTSLSVSVAVEVAGFTCLAATLSLAW